MGLVTGYGSIDAGIERQAWLALQDARADGVVDRIDHIDTIDSRDRATNIAYFADAGYDIVVTTGAGIASETAEAAQQHPSALFVIIQPAHESLEAPSNLIEFEFLEERGGFLAGAAAAMLTRTGRVAAICEARYIDSVERYCEGFRAGVNFIDAQVETQVLYRAGADELLFVDTEWGTAAAAQVVENGADVVFAVGETTARAALVRAASDGAAVIGAQTDVFEEVGEIREQLVTSAIPDVREGLLVLISASVNRQLPVGSYMGDMGLAPFHEFEALLPPGAAIELLDMASDLNNGSLETNLSFDGP